MNNYLPTETYYVYEHFHPDTDEVVYIGHGWKGRAWTHGNASTVLRSQEHTKWLDSINLKGYLPCDYVRILARGLYKTDACKLEQELIREKQPTFNKPQGLQHLKVTDEVLERMLHQRKLGGSYSTIAKEVGLSAMTVYRAVNKQTKNLQGKFN